MPSFVDEVTLVIVGKVVSTTNASFAANDPAKGGSFYLQSKIYRAKEVLDKLHAGSSSDPEE